MHWKAAVLVGIAITSGLMSAYHMYLLSSRGSKYISVALEIPLQRYTDHSTNLELNIQSISHDRTTDKDPVRHKDPVEQDTTWQLSKSVNIQQHGAVTDDGSQQIATDSTKKAVQYSSQAGNTPLEEVWGEGVMSEEVWREGGVMSEIVWGEDGVMLRRNDGEVGEEELGEDNEDYMVLLDTGDYELEEKDMDRAVDATLPPATTHAVTVRANGKRKHIKPRPHETQSSTAIDVDIVKERESKISAPQDLSNGENTNTLVTELQQAGWSRGMADTVASDLLSQTNIQGGPNKANQKVAVISKEEYYARQATSTYPPPLTHLHKTTGPKTINGNDRTSSQCVQPPCLHYLSMAEKKIFNKCQRRTVPHKSTQSAPKCQCRFREGSGMKRVALVSLPGSGNTWLRGLLEKATGLCTGSIYCDRTLREGGFCGEGLHGTSIVAVKTHDSSLQWSGGRRVDSSRPMFDKAIFLIRNPFQANIAEWNRQMSKKHASDQVGSSHVKYVTSKAFFGKQGGWQALVKYQTHKWRMMIGSNLKAMAAGRPVLVVFFEDLKVDPAPQLARMLQFLEVPSSPDIINATLMDGYTAYYRNHTDNFEHYTAEQIVFVNDIILQTAKAVRDKGHEDIVSHIKEYLRH